MKNSIENKTILISGASGLLGNQLVDQLLQTTNYKVVALTSQRDKLLAQFNHENLHVLHMDTWKEDIDSDIQIDVFINCAFPRSSDPEQLAKGLVFTENIMKDAISQDIRSIINISSQSVYSQQEKEDTSESLTVAPESLYGMAKYASERIIETVCESAPEKIFFSNIRLASLTGLDFNVRMTNRFVKSALANEPITINGGNQLISYLEVRDAATALIRMIDGNRSDWKRIYNLGNNESFTLIELTDVISEIAAQHSINHVEIIRNEGQANFSNLINSELFYTDFKWTPKYKLRTMVEELFIHHKNRV